MAKATPPAELIASIRAAADIVNEALPLTLGFGSNAAEVADQTAIRAAAMSQTVRELYDNEIEGL